MSEHDLVKRKNAKSRPQSGLIYCSTLEHKERDVAMAKHHVTTFSERQALISVGVQLSDPTIFAVSSF